MEKNTIIFRFATLRQLMDVVNIKQLINDEKFEEWFNYKHKITDDENKFLKRLIEIHRLYLTSYNEQKLSIRVIGPIFTSRKIFVLQIKKCNTVVKQW